MLIWILRDTIKNIPSIGDAKPFDGSLDTPTIANIEYCQKFLREKFSISNKDFVMIVPVVDGKTIPEKWKKMNDDQKEIWRKQLSINIQHQYYYLKGFDAASGFFIPPGYSHLTEYCQNFFKENPNFSKNVFIMMKFDSKNQQLNNVETEIRSTLTKNGFNPLRADDKVYPNDRDLWDNVCVYMLCCNQGIAVLENKSKMEFNPNVGIEYGFMRALNKKTLLLADKNFPKDRADIVGKLRSTFSIEKPTQTIKNPLEKWIKEIT